jgi:EamA-like transporter family protein
LRVAVCFRLNYRSRSDKLFLLSPAWIHAPERYLSAVAARGDLGRVVRVFLRRGTGVVRLLYYRLIADIGSTKALTITFLMPAFSMIWAVLFLGEDVTALMMNGGALLLGGTALVVIRS